MAGMALGPGLGLGMNGLNMPTTPEVTLMREALGLSNSTARELAGELFQGAVTTGLRNGLHNRPSDNER